MIDAELRARILARWPSAESFYRERDDRTLRGVAELHAHVDRPVEVWVDPLAAEYVTIQRIALVAANLMARWARNIRVLVGPGVLDNDWTRRIADEMEMADPFGDFAVVAQAPDATTPDALRLFVGPWRESRHTTGDQDYVVHAQSWTALGRRGDVLETATRHALGATAGAIGLAASLGVADVFKRAIGHSRDRWMRTFAWDTWSSNFQVDLDAWPKIEDRAVLTKLDLGNMLLAGVGAIGSAFVYLADFMEMRGTLAPFDRDRVEASNLNRSPLFTVIHALDNTLKTQAAERFLSRQAIDTNVTNGVWREHAATFGDIQFDIWISLTNEDGAWAEVPFQLPPVVLHATTTSGWGFGTGRHIPRVEDCTLCRMPRPAAEFRGPCAQGEVARVEGREIRASLPFLSTAAAALLLSSVLQLQTAVKAADLPNDVAADLAAGLPSVIALNRVPRADCRGCKASRSHAWVTRGGRGRFAALSKE